MLKNWCPTCAAAIALVACAHTTSKSISIVPLDPSAYNNAITVSANVLVSAAHPTEGHYETHAAAHPTDPSRLIATAIIYPKVGKRGTIVYASSDGGRTWTPSFEGPALENTGDPAVAYGSDGTAFFAALTLRGNPLEDKPAKPAHNWDGRKTLLYRLSPGATQWSAPSMTLFADREYVAIDPSHAGRIYISGDPRPNSGFVLFTSTNNGATLPNVQGVEADVRGESLGNAVVTSTGTVVGVYADSLHTRAVISNDGARTVLPSIVIDTFVRAGGRKDASRNNVNHFMNAAIDHSMGPYKDRIYVTWPDRRTGHSRVWFTYSSDGGHTWARSQMIRDGAQNDTTDDFMPTLAVNRDGVVGLLWYDRRDNPDNRGYYARFTASRDGGRTWLPSVRVAESPFVAGAVAAKSAFAANGGDTAGLAVTADGAFHPVWVDDRTGVPQVYTSAITVR